MKEALEQLLATYGEWTGRRLLAQIAKPAVVAEFDRLALLELACSLLDAGMPRSDVCARLMGRGLSSATAYRVIGAALDARVSILLTEGRSLRSGTAMLSRTHPTEDHFSIMSTTEATTIIALHELAPVRAMASKCDSLKAELASIDLASLQLAFEQAERDYEGVRKLAPSNALARFFNAEGHQQAVAKAYQAFKAARDHLHDRTGRSAVLRREIAELDSMLTAKERGDEARRKLGEAALDIKTAEQMLRGSQTAYARIVEMIREAESAFGDAKATAAAAVLAAVKTGAGASSVSTPTRDRIETLIAAKASAEAEIASASAAVGAARERHESLRDAIAEANSWLRKLAEYIARDAYQQTLQEVLAQHTIAETAGTS